MSAVRVTAEAAGSEGVVMSARSVSALLEILLCMSQDVTAVLDTSYWSRALFERARL